MQGEVKGILGYHSTGRGGGSSGQRVRGQRISRERVRGQSRVSRRSVNVEHGIDVDVYVDLDIGVGCWQPRELALSCFRVSLRGRIEPV